LCLCHRNRIKRENMPRLRNGELSQTKRAIRDRELSAANRAANREVIMSSEPLGIRGEKREPIPGPETEDWDDEQTYICLNCQAPIRYGSHKCGVCEEQLNWEGL